MTCSKWSDNDYELRRTLAAAARIFVAEAHVAEFALASDKSLAALVGRTWSVSLGTIPATTSPWATGRGA
jgi:hypothetical protein